MRFVFAVLLLALLPACAADVASPDLAGHDAAGHDLSGPDLFAAVDTPVAVDTPGEEVEEPPDHFDFTVVALPDTQIYSARNPEVFLAQARWIAENLEAEKILFVTHLGDVVNSGDRTVEWENARAAMDLLDEAGVAYGVCLGNHDTEDRGGYDGASEHEGCSANPVPPCAGTVFIDNFGPQRYVDRPWYGGASPSALSSYQVVEHDGEEFLFLHLAVDPWAAEIEWAEEVLAAHPDAAVALSTHRYLFDFRMTKDMPAPLPALAARRFDAMMVDFVQGRYMVDGWIAEELFQWFVRVHPQIYLVQCGHIDAEYYQTSLNEADLPVHELLTDFQSLPDDGGNGYMRLLRYDVARGRVRAQTWSPTLGRFRENGESCDFSAELVRDYFYGYENLISDFVDFDNVARQIDYWTLDETGREEFCHMLYDGGQRDSDFYFDVNFDAHRAAAR